MAANAYFSANFDSNNDRLPIGDCKHRPSHTAFLTKTPEDKFIIHCTNSSQLKISQVRLAAPLASLNNGLKTRKLDLTQRLSFHIDNYANGTGSLNVGTSIMRVPRMTLQGPIEDGTSSAGEESECGSDADQLASSSAEPIEDGTMVLADRAFTTRSMTAYASQLTAPVTSRAAEDDNRFPILYYDSSQDNVVLFNMFHVSRTTILNAATLVINSAAVYEAYRARDSIALWGTIVDSFRAYMPAPLVHATPNFQRLLGNMLLRNAVPDPRINHLAFHLPPSSNSTADSRLRQVLARRRRSSDSCNPTESGRIVDLSSDEE